MKRRSVALLQYSSLTSDLTRHHFGYRSKVFSNNSERFRQFLDWLEKQEALKAHLCMETTGAYGRSLARFLAQQQLLISVMNPALIHAFGKTELSRAKTDKADARLIARYCQMRRPAPWVPPTEANCYPPGFGTDSG